MLSRAWCGLWHDRRKFPSKIPKFQSTKMSFRPCGIHLRLRPPWPLRGLSQPGPDAPSPGRLLQQQLSPNRTRTNSVYTRKQTFTAEWLTEPKVNAVLSKRSRASGKLRDLFWRRKAVSFESARPSRYVQIHFPGNVRGLGNEKDIYETFLCWLWYA